MLPRRLVRLEAKGLIIKRTNESDRRSVLISLTRKGEGSIERVTPIVRDVNDILFQDVGLRGLVRAHIVARRLVANSGEARSHLRKVLTGPAKKPGRRTGGTATAAEKVQQIG